MSFKLLSLFSLGVLVSNVASVPALGRRSESAEQLTPGLDALFKAKGKKYWGAAADNNTLTIPENAGIVRSTFGQVTSENSMKWERTEISPRNFSFAEADILVDFAVANGKLIRGHTLLWHSQLPTWVREINDKDALTAAIQGHIAGVAGRYAGKLYGELWDVVNEIFDDDGNFRETNFFRVLGESFVTIAFEAAKAADPTAIRYINDYDLDSNNSKTRGMVALVKRVNAANPGLIQGLGTQMHLAAGETAGVHAALATLASAGTGEVAITELDINGGSPTDYVVVAQACLNIPECVGITSWGVSDVNSWRGVESASLLYDEHYQKKPAYDALVAER